MTKWIRVSIESDLASTDTGWAKWFENFFINSGYKESDEPLDYFLEPYNARNVFAEPYIEFESEQDYLMFKLRWA